ncbi:hypothetical protein ACF09G_13050 [Streptomyces albogriseolus]|uniref:hypothetical protein n=1 Tax=Streptomyces albogriseolus TaxID=1887 RepID=UPI002256D99F|nr:hypothetical protein [Streptomyces viridodiastaticus]MCX4622805.1 hypothetical protein [Streptomyces viridodiastaticus]
MSDTKATEPQATEPGETPAGEPGPGSERAARLVLTGVLLLAMWGIVAVLPETAYVVVGVLGTIGWQKARSWARRRRGDDQEDDPDETGDEQPEAVTETLHRLAEPHVFLADFATARDLSTDTARAVLEALGIRVRRAVRNGTRTGVGVHRDDIPPLPRPPSGPPVGAVDQGQPTNQQGVRVERTETGGYRIFDLDDPHRHHQVGSH